MARASTSSAPNPYWCNPKRLLAIFCAINLINYLDRGAIASNGVNGSRRMCSESGARSSGSGIQVKPFRLIGVGLTVWTVAVAFLGFSFNFGT